MQITDDTAYLEFFNSECRSRGYYRDTVQNECIPCPYGTYSGTENAVNADSCTACPEGQTTSEEGSTSIDQCYIGFF